MIVHTVMKSRRKFPPALSTCDANEVRISGNLAKIYVEGKLHHKLNLKEWIIDITR